MNVVVGIASIPNREQTLKVTINSIYNQVDVIYLSLNGYNVVPEWIKNKDKIKAEILDNSLGDAAKFLHVNKSDKYFFSMDDDLIYPANYVKYMISGINKYKSIVTLHGRTYPKPFSSFKKWNGNYRCLNAVKNDVEADLGGTGVMAFDVNMFYPNIHIFQYRNMADCFIAKEAFKQGVKIMVLKHKHGYIKQQKVPGSIWHSSNNKVKETNILKSFL